MSEILVDVVAMAASLGRPASKSRPSTAMAAGGEAVSALPATQTCPLGHQHASGARFCATCGMPMGEVTLGPRVDLEAVREAVRSGSSLDPAERVRRDQEHIEALAANARAEQGVVSLAQQPDPSQQKILVHFVADGFTWAGEVWYAGQELEIGPEHPRWESALSWIRLSKTQQFQRYGRVFFDFGPFPGQSAPPGTVMSLPTAGVAQWAILRGGVPAEPSPDRDGSLIPR